MPENPMRKYTISFGVTQMHDDILNKFQQSTGLTRSEILRLMIETLSPCTIERDEFFNFRFVKPKQGFFRLTD